MIVSDLIFPRLGPYLLIAARSLEEKSPKDDSEDLRSSRGSRFHWFPQSRRAERAINCRGKINSFS